MAYQKMHPESPWLTKAMVEILASWLRPEDRGLEWGSGRSTIWFAQRVSGLISMEHNDSWHHKIRTQLDEKGLRNVDYRLCTEQSVYVSAIEDLPTESLEFVLVDGIARDKCALAAIPRLKPGGILIVDNSNWYLPSESRSPDSRRPHQQAASEPWQEFLDKVRRWRKIWTTNGVWDSTLWVKCF